MGGYYGEYYDLARRVEDTYQEVDSDACVDLRENDEEYSKLWLESIKLQDDFPVIEQVVDGNGEVSLTGEEHEALLRYLELKNEMENMEQKGLLPIKASTPRVRRCGEKRRLRSPQAGPP